MRHLETLNDLASSPQVMPMDMTTVRLKPVAKAAQVYCKSASMQHPETDAVRFYFLNHAVAEISKKRVKREVLSANELKIVHAYQQAIAEMAPRMLYYLLLITTREARHATWKPTGAAKLQAKVSEATAEFFIQKKMNDSGAMANSFHSICPDVDFGDYAIGLVEAFRCGSYGKMFGGAKWAAIAKCLKETVHGEISLERMLDEAFALQHNTCSIFNKGMLFHHFDGKMTMILDAQRGGQIPALVRSGALEDHQTMNVDPILDLCASMFGGVFATDEVDWAAVKAAGAVGHYGHYTPTVNPKPKLLPGQIGLYTVQAGSGHSDALKVPLMQSPRKQAA